MDIITDRSETICEKKSFHTWKKTQIFIGIENQLSCSTTHHHRRLIIPTNKKYSNRTYENLQFFFQNDYNSPQHPYPIQIRIRPKKEQNPKPTTQLFPYHPQNSDTHHHHHHAHPTKIQQNLISIGQQSECCWRSHVSGMPSTNRLLSRPGTGN